MGKKKIRLDFWNKSFYKETAFGRTLSGRNKTGQTVGVIKDTALSFVPLVGKPLKEATGKITDAMEASELGKRPEELNLSPKVILVIRVVVIAVLGYLVVRGILGIDEARDIQELINESGITGLVTLWG